MKRSTSITLLVIVIMLFSTAIGPAKAQGLEPQTGVGQAFIYQGRLVKNGSPFTGSCDFTFTLWNVASGGSSPLGSEPKTGVSVASGVFTVLLNETGQFGAGAFDGSQRWLGISVKCTGDSSATDLGRQALSAAPYASYALTAGSVTNGVLTTGSYADPAWITSLAATKITGAVPNATYAVTAGSVTNGVLTTGSYADPAWITSLAGTKISGTVANATRADTAGSVTNGVVTTGNYADPAWITSLSASKISGVLPVVNGGTGSATQNFVDLSSSQAVAGVKTFNTSPIFNVGSALLHHVPFIVGNYSNVMVNNLNADLLDGQHASAFQGRVNGTCAVGSTIQAINADGSVVCQADAPLNRPGIPQANTIITPDSNGNVGQSTSVTVGADGLPVISYQDHTNHALKVLHCGNAACSSGNTSTTVDSSGDVELYTSVTLGVDGLAVISYYDYGNGDLKVLHCGNASCSSGNISTTVDSSGDVGSYPSITIGVDGLPIISYHDNTNLTLKVSHCWNSACSSGITRMTVDSIADVGMYSSITLGADGLPVISYFDNTNLTLKVAHCGDFACSTAVDTAITADGSSDVGMYTSITVGADDMPVISYYDQINGDLKVLHCGNASCSSGNTSTTVDSSGNVGWYTSITLGADGLPVISYYDATNANLKVLHCGNVTCSSGNTSISIDSSGDVGWYTSITLGADGLPVISYYDNTNGDLKVVHCSNAFCTPFFRRR